MRWEDHLSRGLGGGTVGTATCLWTHHAGDWQQLSDCHRFGDGFGHGDEGPLHLAAVAQRVMSSAAWQISIRLRKRWGWRTL